MIAFQHILLGLNLLLALVFGMDFLVIDSPKVKPRTKENAAVLLASLFIAFLVLLLLFAILSVAQKRNALYLALLAYVAAPFAIGRLASYRTLAFYSGLQMLVFVASAVTLFLI